MNLTEFHFVRPDWLWAAIPYLLLLGLLLKSKLSQGNWSNVCDAELLPYILQDKMTGQSRWPLTTGAIAGFLTIVALAGPTWKRLPTPVFRNASALVIVLDLSRSMDAADIKPNRISRARFKIADILQKRQDGQTALIVYAGDAFTVTPLTEDTDTINSQLSALTTAIMPTQGSDTGLALTMAVDLFKQAGLQEGQILLVTDGVNYSRTLEAVENLGAYKLSILGIGTAEGAPIKTSSGGFVQDKQGSIVVPKLDQTALQELAKAGGGEFQAISPDDSDIESLLVSIDRQSARQESEFEHDFLLEQWDEMGPWLLFLILPLAALSFRRGIL